MTFLFKLLTSSVHDWQMSALGMVVPILSSTMNFFTLHAKQWARVEVSGEGVVHAGLTRAVGVSRHKMPHELLQKNIEGDL